MVIVKWSEREGLSEICPADGPGEYTDDVAIKQLRDSLDTIEEINEKVIAAAVLSNYSGSFSERAWHVTTDSYQDGEYVATIAFVELDHPEDKLTAIHCQECGYFPQEAREWDFQKRVKNDWIYHDWICPDCSKIVHTELIESPVSCGFQPEIKS